MDYDVPVNMRIKRIYVLNKKFISIKEHKERINDFKSFIVTEETTLFQQAMKETEPFMMSFILYHNDGSLELKLNADTHKNYSSRNSPYFVI
jgi:hypothetical protein